ncbi:MAG TPA: hypothetical protein VMV45_14860 [Casimicrobiaceae bacterium]|nr:hypothetical protein [Casimicrobiaceae bacterium]
MIRAASTAFTVALLASLLHGCATPAPVLDLANRGVGATSLAEAELRRYLAASQDQLSLRVFLVSQSSKELARENFEDAFGAYLRRKAGDRTGEDSIALIEALGQEHQRLRLQLEADAASAEELEHATLGDRLVPSADAFAAARKAFSTLGQELTPQERLALTTLYARTIIESVKKIRESAKDNAAASSKDATSNATPKSDASATGNPQ